MEWYDFIGLQTMVLTVVCLFCIGIAGYAFGYIRGEKKAKQEYVENEIQISVTKANFIDAD